MTPKELLDRVCNNLIVDKVYRMAFVIGMIGAGFVYHIGLICKDKVVGAIASKKKKD